MAQYIYRLADIVLPNGLTYYDIANELQYVPNSLQIFIATSTGYSEVTDLAFGYQTYIKKEFINWDAFGLEDINYDYDGNIIDLSPLRLGFDYKNMKFNYEDIEFEALNIDGFWDRRVYNSTNKIAEIRIIHCKNAIIHRKSTIDEVYKVIRTPIFWGKIDLNIENSKYSYVSPVSFDPPGAALKYSVRCYDINSLFVERNIIDLYDALKALTPDYSKTQITSQLVSLTMKQDNNNITINYVTVYHLFQTLINIVYPSHQLSINADAQFRHYKTAFTRFDFLLTQAYSNPESIPQYVLVIPVSYTRSGVTYYDGTMLDKESYSTVAHSIFNFETCLKYLDELSKNFGLVFTKSYSIPNSNYGWKWNKAIKLISRSTTSGTLRGLSDIVSLPENKKEYSQNMGGKITVSYYTDIVYGSGDIAINNFLLTQQAISVGGSVLDIKKQVGGNRWFGTLFGYNAADGSIYTTEFVFSAFLNEEFTGDTTAVEAIKNWKGWIGLAKYLNKYIMSLDGCFGQQTKIMEFEVDGVEADEGVYIGNWNYNYLMPFENYIFRVNSETFENYIMINCEKDFIKNKTKITVKNYG